MSDVEHYQATRNLIQSKLKKCTWGARGWSTAHHVTAYGAILAALLAGYLAKLPANQWAQTCAFVGAVLAALASTGDFKRKWAANRHTRTALEVLTTKTLDGFISSADAMKSLEHILEDHDGRINGLPHSASNPKGEAHHASDK